jgi:dipeptidyl aminopeptidase/acylaminoacyl peptidase
MKRFAVGLCALALAGLAPPASLAQSAPPPAAAFARLPAVQTATVSPSGQKIAMLGGGIAERVITISPVDGQAAVTIPLGAVDVNGIRWASDAYLIATVRIFDSQKNFSDGRTYSYNMQRDIVFDMQGKIVGLLLDGANWSSLATTRPILGDIEGDKPAVVMFSVDAGSGAEASSSRIKQKNADYVWALYRVDVASGKGRVTERGSEGTVLYAVDRAGEARVRIDHEKGQASIFARGKRAAVWSLIDKSPQSSRSVVFLGYSDPEDAIYLFSETDGGARIVRRSLADGAETVVGPAKASPAADLLWDIRAGLPVAIVTGGGDRPEYQWLDPKLGAIHAKLSRGLKGRHVQFVSWSKDMSRIVLRADSPSHAPAWFLYEPATNQASPIGEEYPELAGAAFGKTNWISYKAKDGLQEYAYLTVPANLAPGVKAPLIVMPHGGPASRDEFGFGWWEQFLVSRGYAVLQPQFRGSAGFGGDFERAGFNEWGGKMQSDLIDAVDAVSDPAVDSKRVCIVGASFGGYAALHGATMRPDRYRCAISVNGVSDLTSMLGHAKIYSGGDSEEIRYLRDVIGDSRNTPETLNDASPYHRVGGRTSPTLLIYAANDTTVPPEQSTMMVTALTNAGAPHRVVVLDGDDHYFSSSKSRLQTLEATEAFLAKYLPIQP